MRATQTSNKWCLSNSLIAKRKKMLETNVQMSQLPLVSLPISTSVSTTEENTLQSCQQKLKQANLALIQSLRNSLELTQPSLRDWFAHLIVKSNASPTVTKVAATSIWYRMSRCLQQHLVWRVPHHLLSCNNQDAQDHLADRLLLLQLHARVQDVEHQLCLQCPC